MPFIACTQHLREVGPSQLEKFPGATVREALQAVGAQYPRLLGYVLDDQGQVRQHVAIFVRGELHKRNRVLDEPVAQDDEIYVLQALSGG
jgi:molybdopterin synthase sulfur carrier subunit